MGSLSNLYISQSYQSLIHLATNNTASATLIGLEDGLGNSIGVSVNTAGNLYLSGTFSASLQEGYIYVGNSSSRTIAFPTASLVTNIDTGSLVTTSSFNAYTASTNIRLSNIEITTASILVSISNLNAFTQSANTRLNNLETTSASVNTSITNINQYTQSNDLKWQDLGSKSGSWITESETGSFARYDVSNPWSANQTFTNITAVSASFTYVQTLFETASVIYSSGSNQFGDELTDIQTLSGSVKIRGGLLINNLDVTGSINSLSDKTGSYATTGSNTFVGNQTISNGANLNVSGNISLTGNNSRITFPNGTYMLGTPGDTFGVNSDGSSQQFEVGDSSITPSAKNITFRNTTPNGQISFRSLNGGTIILSGSATEIQNVSFIPFSQSLDSRLDLLESSSSLALYTASFDNGTRNLTFTKGDTTTFAVNIPDVSGSAGDFVTTSSFNAYTSSNDQRVSSLETNSGSVNTSITNINSTTASLNTSVSALNTFTASQSTASLVTSIDNLNNFSASALTSISNLNQSSASQQVSIDALNTNSASVNTSITNINSATASLFTSASLALVTASFASQTLTFTKGDGTTFGLLIPDISGSTIDTGSFVTTSSFNAYTQSNDQRVASLESNSASVNTSITNINTATASLLVETSNLETFSASALISLSNLNTATASLFTSASLSLTTASVSLNTITFTKGDNTTFNITVNTGSDGQTFANPSVESISGSLVLSALTFNSGAANLLHLSASAQNQANLVFKNNNLTSTTQVSGSNNIFVNPTAPTANFARFVGGFGNIYMNSGSVPQITASAASVSGNRPTMNNNIIPSNITWNINQAGNPGAHIYSNNILENGTLNFNTTGNTGAVTFSNNIGLVPTVMLNAPSASVANVLAGVSGSNAVTIQANIIQGTITYNGPVSSSAHSMTFNNIAGTLTMNVQSGSRAYALGQNNINGTLTINDQVVNGPTVGSQHSISANNINGTVTLTNRASASMNIANSSLNAFVITNDYDSMTNGTTGRQFVLQGNTIFGAVGNNIYFSGSAAGAGTTFDRSRGLYGNLLGGSRISASVIGDGNRHLLASAIVGQGLNIYGTSLYDASSAGIAGGQNGGSAFFGRWNAEDGNRALSAQTVFVVGTGVSGSTGIVRKTGFLIDSGSNAFFEGNHFISGSTTLSGSLFIQSGSNLPTSTGSVLLTYNNVTGQVTQAPYSTIVSASVSSAEFWSTTTQSGSAGVSGSVTFNNSGSFYNVSVVNGTQLQVANAGVYNIQFSAQIETSAGADTLWIWFKKNGTNIGDSASKAVLANNTAQIMTVNILDEAAANDYYEIAYQNLNGNATVLAEVASGNIPAIPSVIATIFQIR